MTACTELVEMKGAKVSRIGKKEILIPEGVTVDLKDGVLTIRGVKGALALRVNPRVAVEIKEGKILVSTKGRDKASLALWGTTRQAIANMIVGVSQGWSKTLEVVGTGYRPNLVGEKLSLSLGFSRPVESTPPEGITFSVSENKITVSGVDKSLVGEVAASLRRLRPPDAYKGKGIRYQGEEIKLKPGKAAKVGPGIGGK